VSRAGCRQLHRAGIRNDERGVTESVQIALIWPLLLLVTLGVIQAGLWVHGRQAALRAAIAAVDEASGSAGSSAAARDLATDIASSAGLNAVAVDVETSGTTVRVVVSGTTPSILDLPLGRITESAAAPRELVSTP
jgi:Flp pilus assembly protein TadG